MATSDSGQDAKGPLKAALMAIDEDDPDTAEAAIKKGLSRVRQWQSEVAAGGDD